MIYIKKRIILSTLLLTTLGSGVVVSSAFAQTPSPKHVIAQKFADKFNLNVTDVESFFQQLRTEKMAKNETNYENWLTQHVKDGKITDAQKQLLIAKRKELKTNSQAFWDKLKSMTKDQRKAELQKQKQALEDWAKQNNIDIKYLRGGFGMKAHGWIRRNMMFSKP